MAEGFAPSAEARAARAFSDPVERKRASVFFYFKRFNR
jgi:hypothetical protein